MNPYIKSVKPQEDYCLLLTFANGEKRVFDLKPYLEKPVFRQLKNIALFQTAKVVSGSVEWQGEVDLSYDTLYLESKPSNQAGNPESPFAFYFTFLLCFPLPDRLRNQLLINR
jgi:hypothetical protein